MTAEVAILNREAVALAADSAATLAGTSGQKIFSSANKVFALSKYHPVGVMIYGNALFMSVPWEVIIKIYRHQLGNTRFNTLAEYGSSFIEFLKGDIKLFPDEQQESWVGQSVFTFYLAMKNRILEKVDERLQDSELTEEEIGGIVDDVVQESLNMWKGGGTNIPNVGLHQKAIKAKYKGIIDKAIDIAFENLEFSAKSKRHLHDLAGWLCITFPDEIQKQSLAGVVISGFGEDDIFPSVISFLVDGIANDVLKYKEVVNEGITFNRSALVYPFAQKDMVVTFIDGISDVFRDLYEDLLIEAAENYPSVILNAVAPGMPSEDRAKLLEKIRKVGIKNLQRGLDKIGKVGTDRFVNPIMSVVTHLSKNELADMAESLVNLTCLRKKISMDDETVGGPIDVAVISKGDGFVWIKRKHYFPPDLNRAFFDNYFKER